MMPGAGVATPTGRVGHLFRYDVPSLHYRAENKHIKIGSLWRVWKQVADIAKLADKHPLVRIEPTNPDARQYPKLHIISEQRHQELLAAEQWMLSYRPKDGILDD